MQILSDVFIGIEGLRILDYSFDCQSFNISNIFNVSDEVLIADLFGIAASGILPA